MRCKLHLFCQSACLLAGDWWQQPLITRAKFWDSSDADADLSPDQNLLVPAIIATAIQLSCFCVHL